MSFSDSLNPTYLPTLSITERDNASSLIFYPDTDNYSWDNEAFYYSTASYALLHDTFSIHLQQGATYDILSSSYFDPYILMVYDSNGIPVVANLETNDFSDTTTMAYDNILDFIAPTTGIYYISASWHQGSYYKTVTLFVTEEIDTTLAINTAPTITSSSTATIAENTPIATVIYDANATDLDTATTLSYSLSGTDASLLNINSSNGEVTLKTSADYETKNSYSFNVIASDGSLSDTQAVTVSVTDVNEAPTQTNTTKAKIFLISDDPFTLSNSGATLYGSSGTNDSVKIALNTSAITLNQNIERVIFEGTLSDYHFAQGGNTIKVYDATTNTLLLTTPLQGDSDGTLFTFSDGSTSAKIASGSMLLGTATLSNTATAKTTSLDITTTTSSFTSNATSDAKVFLQTGDSFKVNNSGATIYGSDGEDVVTLASGVTGVALNQNTERVMFEGDSNAYKFAQGGNTTKIYDATTNTLLATTPLQGDSDGTLFTFINGTISAKITSGVMHFGGVALSSTPSAISPLNIDTTLTTPSSTTNSVNVSSSASVVESDAINTTYTIANGTYTYTINGFGEGDVLDFPDDMSPTITNDDWSDGMVDIQYAYSGNVAIVQLIGLSVSEDASLNTIADVNALFGAGTIA